MSRDIEFANEWEEALDAESASGGGQSCSEDDDASERAALVGRRHGSARARAFVLTRGAAVVGGACLAALGCCAAAALTRSGVSRSSSATPREVQESVLTTPAVTAVTGSVSTTIMNPEGKALFDKYMGSDSAINREVSMNDGNLCNDDEEQLKGLCYKKCALLTNGTHPIRTSPMTCCEKHPCSFFNQKVGAGMCSGYDVSGELLPGGCPHTPGTCLADEELKFNVCYKKCTILTNGQFPNRVAPLTCCKAKGFSCFNPLNLDTNQAYDVGGGDGDGDKATPADHHLPMTSLTENGVVTSTLLPR